MADRYWRYADALQPPLPPPPALPPLKRSRPDYGNRAGGTRKWSLKKA